jgi:hypothetical protein
MNAAALCRPTFGNMRNELRPQDSVTLGTSDVAGAELGNVGDGSSEVVRLPCLNQSLMVFDVHPPTDNKSIRRFCTPELETILTYHLGSIVQSL